MRPAYAGPGSGRYKPIQDPGKSLPSSNFGGKTGGTDANSAAAKGANAQQSAGGAKKE